MSESFSVNKSVPVSGLGTFNCTVPADGLYQLEVKSTIPSVVPGSAQDTAAVEINDITVTGDTMSDLNNTYFVISGAGNVAVYYVWYNVASAGSDPFGPGVGIEVEISEGDNSTAVGLATRAAIAANAPEFAVSGATSHVTLTNINIGACDAAYDADSPNDTGFDFDEDQVGSYGGGSGLTITIELNEDDAPPLQVQAYPTPSQQSMGASMQIECEADDEIEVILSSTAPADQLPNAVKSVINLYQIITE